MQKVRLAVCIGDTEYQNRFTNCLLGHYRNQFELHIFTNPEQITPEAEATFDMLLCADYSTEWKNLQQAISKPLLYLLDEEKEEEQALTEGEGRGVYVDKYQEVNKIVDEILKNIGGAIQAVKSEGSIPQKTQIMAVYSLSENEYQLPFIVTLASILSEKERVLVLDLQENSGFSQLIKERPDMGLEELLVMVEGGRYTKSRLLSCVGHLDSVDYIYPVENSECLCDAGQAVYMKLLQLLTQELDYGVILLNLGSRFTGFFELMNRCQEVYFMQSQGGLSQWREYEFREELESRGYKALTERMRTVQIPIFTNPAVSCERLVEQWKWNEFGDMIRGMTPGVAAVG